MPNPLQLLNGGQTPAAPPEQPNAALAGYVGEIVRVDAGQYWALIPAFSSLHSYGPLEFVYSRGATLPVVGNKCLVGFDNEKTPYLLWFSGAHS